PTGGGKANTRGSDQPNASDQPPSLQTRLGLPRDASSEATVPLFRGKRLPGAIWTKRALTLSIHSTAIRARTPDRAGTADQPMHRAGSGFPFHLATQSLALTKKPRSSARSM